MKYTVYMHVAPNDKKYIGITSQKPKRRWQYGEGYKKQVFYKAIQKYGWNNIQHVIIAKGLTEQEAKWIEQKLIKVNKTTEKAHGYNISLGGDSGGHLKGRLNPMYGKSGELSPRFGEHLSEETKRRISESNKGRIISEETRKRISVANKGHSTTENVRRALIKANTGRNNHRARAVICLTTMTIFLTISEANQYYNISKGNITKCCAGKKKSAGKHNGEKLIWRYIEITEL